MTSKTSLSGHALAVAMTATSVFVVSALVASKPNLAQTAPAAGTTSIERGSETEKALKMKEPSFQTREERLNTMPLDWNSTIGEPTPRTLTPAEEEALQKGQPESSQGGAPNPNADEEARKLHPEDWNLAATAPAGVTTGATTSIERGSEAEKALKMKESSFQTREERLNAMPLDWNSTIGEPTPRTLSPGEEEALQKGQPESTQGGAPNPNADEEARKLHPDDWK